MKNTHVFALLLTTCCAQLAGCAQGTVDDTEPGEAVPAVHMELWDGAAQDVETVTAEAFQARTITDPANPQAPVYTEAEACDAIVGGYHAHGLEIGCATTTHVCPDMLRFAFGQACLQFEGESVNECVRKIGEATTCEDLWNMSCDVVPVPESAGAGCPADPQ